MHLPLLDPEPSGLSWDIPNAPSPANQTDLLERQARNGFELSRIRRGEIHLFRYQTLRTLAEEPSLSAQAAAFSNWALNTWKQLDADPF